MKPKNLFWLIIEFILLFIFIWIFSKAIKTIGFSLDEFIIFALALYFIIIVIIIFITYNLIEEISVILLPIIKKITKKKEIKPPTEKSKKKPKKKKIKRIKTIQGYTITTEKKGDLFKRLGIKYEKIKKPKTKNVMDLGEIERLEPKIYRRDLTPYIKQLDNKGYIEVSNNDHFGKLRSYDIILYLRKELKRQGIKTKKVRKKLYKV